MVCTVLLTAARAGGKGAASSRCRTMQSFNRRRRDLGNLANISYANSVAVAAASPRTQLSPRSSLTPLSRRVARSIGLLCSPC